MEEQGWRPIETAPKDGTVILGFARKAPRFVFWHVIEPETLDEEPCEGWAAIWYEERVMLLAPGMGWTHKEIEGSNYYYEGDGPTHWQPLPAPPTN